MPSETITVGEALAEGLLDGALLDLCKCPVCGPNLNGLFHRADLFFPDRPKREWKWCPEHQVPDPR